MRGADPRYRTICVDWRQEGDFVEGWAYDESGVPIMWVSGTLGFYGARDADELIDRYLSPRMNGRLDYIVGPRVVRRVTRPS
jgi:hypothetical protein